MVEYFKHRVTRIDTVLRDPVKDAVRLEVAERMAQELRNMITTFHAFADHQLSRDACQFDLESAARVHAEWEALK